MKNSPIYVDNDGICFEKDMQGNDVRIGEIKKVKFDSITYIQDDGKNITTLIPLNFRAHRRLVEILRRKRKQAKQE